MGFEQFHIGVYVGVQFVDKFKKGIWILNGHGRPMEKRGETG
jgi:hypothetical protein